MNAGQLDSIDFVVIHNDAGSMTPEQYVEWLRYRDKYNIGYHTGEWWSNTHSLVMRYVRV